MTREEANALIRAIITIRDAATDETALAAPSIYPVWREGVEYALGQRVRHEGVLYKVLTAHTSQADWMPNVAVSLFTKVLIPNENVIPAWEQPDSTNAYSKGDKVTHNGKTWVSDADNNVWEPGVYGWAEL